MKTHQKKVIIIGDIGLGRTCINTTKTMKTHQLKYTKDYLLLIDPEAKIKTNDYFVNTIQEEVYHNNIKDYNVDKEYLKLIIAYYPLSKEAKELDLPLLPPFEKEIDVEKLAQEVYREYPASPKDKPDWTYNRDIHVHKKRKAFIKGYKAAQSKQLELLKRAIQLASDAENIEEVEQEIIQSLIAQKLPKEFKPCLSVKDILERFSGQKLIVNETILKELVKLKNLKL